MLYKISVIKVIFGQEFEGAEDVCLLNSYATRKSTI